MSLRELIFHCLLYYCFSVNINDRARYISDLQYWFN